MSLLLSILNILSTRYIAYILYKMKKKKTKVLFVLRMSNSSGLKITCDFYYNSYIPNIQFFVIKTEYIVFSIKWIIASTNLASFFLKIKNKIKIIRSVQFITEIIRLNRTRIEFSLVFISSNYTKPIWS